MKYKELFEKFDTEMNNEIYDKYLLKVDGKSVYWLDDKNWDVTRETLPLKLKESYVVSTVGDSSKPWVLTHIHNSPIKE